MNHGLLLSHTLHTLSHLALLYRTHIWIRWALGRDKVGSGCKISRIKLYAEGPSRVWKGGLLRSKT